MKRFTRDVIMTVPDTAVRVRCQGRKAMSTATAVPDPTADRDDLRRPLTRPDLTPERLAAPPAGDRPGIRWWWQSPVAPAELVEELRAIAEAGFGEVEIAFSPGFWADDAQRTALRAVLAEAQHLGVTVAMTLGAAWPLQTPNTTRGTEYASQELQYGVTWLDGEGDTAATGTSADASQPGTRTVPVPRPFDDPDGERPSTLLAVVAARVVERGTEPRVVPSGNPWGKPTKIVPPERSTLVDEDTFTVLDVAGEGADAVVHWEDREGSWALTAFWTRDSEQGVTSFLDADAARAALAYLDEHQIGQARGALDAEGSTATELFEDSLELNADCLFWSPTMLERFIEHNGYDPTPYLPLMIAHGQCRYWVPEEPPRPDFAPVTADGAPSDLGLRVRADLDRLVTDLYVSDHLRLIQDWAVGHGMRHKAQAAYGQNLEPVRSFRELVRCGGRAEVESLNSGDRVPIRMSHPNWRFALDWQRSAVGGAHQGGAVRVSTELGAQMDKCYDFSLADYRQMLDKEWAVGVTRPYVHGFATQAPDAPWPTHGRFGTVVSESWNHRHFPQWTAWKALTDYWARGTAVLETGTPRSDVAVYRDGFLTTAARGNEEADAEAPDRLIDAEPLERHGYSVQVVDPVGLAEAGVIGQEAGLWADGAAGGGAGAVPGAGAQADGAAGAGRTVLFPDGPAYRALVIGEQRVTVGAARAVEAAARAGLAVVVVGEAPQGDTGWGGADHDAEVRAAFAAALACPTVAQVAQWADVPGALARLGVRPRIAWDGPVLLTQVRDAQEGRYVLVYNPAAEPVSLPLDIEGMGSVEVLDLDTGRALPVQVEAGRQEGCRGCTRVRVALADRGLAVLLLRPEGGTGVPDEAAPGDTAPALVPAADPSQAAVPVSGSDDGAGSRPQADAPRTVRVAGAVVGPDSGAWNVAEVGTSPAGAELYLTWGDLVVTTEEPDGARELVLPAEGPADWRAVVGLEQVSGTGVYTAAVVRSGAVDAGGEVARSGGSGAVPTPAQLDGLELCLGPVGGVAVVRVGGRELATVLRDDVVVPVGEALAQEVVAGREALLEIEVSTTLRNATLAADVYMKGPWAVEHPSVPHGLLGPVRLFTRC